MPNGDKTYNFEWCKEKHENIDKEFDVVWKKIGSVETKLWAIIILLFGNLCGLIGVISKI